MRVTFSDCCGRLTRKAFISADVEDMKWTRPDVASLRFSKALLENGK